MDGERARVDAAHRVDEAHHPAGAAQVETGQGVAEGRQVEEGVAGQDRLAVVEEPVVEALLLVGRGMQLVPDVRAASGGTQAGEAELGAQAVGHRQVLVELVDVVARHDDRQLEACHARLGEALHGADRRRERALPADGVVDLGRGAVEADLHVDVVARRQARGDGRGEARAVGRELHADVVLGGVRHEVEEVGADGGLSATDVDVEDLHALELVDERPALGGGELTGVAAARAGEAVDARQVAGVGQLPGQTDRRVEPRLEEVDEAGGGGARRRGAHVPVPAAVPLPVPAALAATVPSGGGTRRQIIPDPASEARARR